MRIVAFLQNQWFKSPDRMKALFDKHYASKPDGREAFIRTFLFWSCLTGRRLRAAFGDDGCDRIVWEEASAEMGGTASSCFPADPEHMRRVVEKHEPDVVLLFGKVAVEGFARALPTIPQAVCVISGPHPVARGGTTVAELNRMAVQLRRATEQMAAAKAQYEAEDRRMGVDR